MSDDRKERWQTKITSLRQGIAHLYETKEFSDVTFVVQGHVLFKGHRLILSSRSPEFTRILLCSNSPEKIIIDKETITETGFEILMRYIYKDIIGTTDKRSIIEAYLTALHFKQKTLLEKCDEEIKSWIINVDEVLELLDAGSDVPALKQKCVHFIRNNACNVIASPSFLNTNLETLCVVLHSGGLDHVQAIERINSIMKWGKNRHKEANDYSAVRAELLASQMSPLSKLGFDTLEPTEIYSVVNNYIGLLEATEVMNLMMYHSGKNESLLPEWCTVSVQNRAV